MILTKEELRYYINEDALQAGYVSLNQIFAPPVAINLLIGWVIYSSFQ